MEHIKIGKQVRDVINRKDQRQFDREQAMINKWYSDVIIPMEKEFFDQIKAHGINHPPLSDVRYETIFKVFNDKFISARDKTNHWRKKLRFIDINMYYFTTLYQPVETEPH